MWSFMGIKGVFGAPLKAQEPVVELGSNRSGRLLHSAAGPFIVCSKQASSTVGFLCNGRYNIDQSWSKVPNVARVSYTSIIPEHSIGNYSGP